MASWQIAVRSEKKYHENTRRKRAEKAVEKEPDTTRVSTAIAIQMQTRQMSVKVARNLHTNLNHFVEPLSASVSARVSARVSVSMSVVCLCVRITRANNISHINSHFNQFACNLRGWHNPRSPSPLPLVVRPSTGPCDDCAAQTATQCNAPVAIVSLQLTPHPLFPPGPCKRPRGLPECFLFSFLQLQRGLLHI